MNHIMIAGHLGADPEVRFTSGGQKVTTLRVACNSRRGGKEETIWWRLTIWGEQFDKMISYFKKGSSIIAWGEMSKPEIYNDRDGKPQISLNMTASQLSFSPFGKSERTEGQPQVQQPQQTQMQQPQQQNQFAQAPQTENPFSQVMQGQGSNFAGSSLSDDEIPF